MHFSLTTYSPVDINECLEEGCGANANCSNTVGGFNCTCHSGYEPSLNGTSCSGTY